MPILTDLQWRHTCARPGGKQLISPGISLGHASRKGPRHPVRRGCGGIMYSPIRVMETPCGKGYRLTHAFVRRARSIRIHGTEVHRPLEPCPQSRTLIKLWISGPGIGTGQAQAHARSRRHTAGNTRCRNQSPPTMITPQARASTTRSDPARLAWRSHASNGAAASTMADCPVSTPILNENNEAANAWGGSPISCSTVAKPNPWMNPKAKASHSRRSRCPSADEYDAHRCERFEPAWRRAEYFERRQSERWRGRCSYPTGCAGSMTPQARRSARASGGRIARPASTKAKTVVFARHRSVEWRE